MNRLLLIVVAVAVVALVGFAVFVIAGGPRQSPVVATNAPVTETPAEAAAPGAPPAAASTEAPGTATSGTVPASAEIKAKLDAWQKVMNAAGFTVGTKNLASADGAVAVSDLDLTGLGWHWWASSARINVASKDNFDITATGDQRLSFTFNGKAVERGLRADGVKIGLHVGNDGSRINSFEFINLTIEGGGDAPPINLGSGGFRVVAQADDDLVPATSDAELRLNDLVIPAEAGNPLGSKLDSLSATLFFQRPLATADAGKALQPWMGQTEALGVRALSLKWGSLKLSGVGVVGLDEAGRPAGRFEVRIADVLAVLDSINALHRFDRNVLAAMYAKLLLDDAREGNDLGLPFTILVTNGSVTLSGQSHGLDDIALGTVGQLYAPAAAE